MNKTRRALLSHVAVAVLALSVGASTVAMAGIAGGVITACSNVATGVLRIETAAAPCIVAGNPLLARAPLLIEERVTWNQVGQPGPTGAQGPKGATGDVGPAGLNWRGQYDSTHSYAAGDAVQFQGSAYVATSAMSATSCAGTCVDGNAPGVSSSWQLLASAGTKGDAGPQGAPGDVGAQGPAGPAGSGLSGYEIVDTGLVLVGPLQEATATAVCTPGKRVLSGGVGGPVPVVTSRPDSINWTGWVGSVSNTALLSVHFKVYAICVDL
jgi:hypothetical protein